VWYAVCNFWTRAWIAFSFCRSSLFLLLLACDCIVGKKQLKVSGLLKHKHYDDPAPPDDAESIPKTQRSKYSDKYQSTRSQYKVNGVKRAILFGLVPQKASEDHHFLCDLFEEAGITYEDWNWCIDIKVIVAMVGLQSCSSKFPNPFCLWSKGDTGRRYPLRTFEHIRQQSAAWQASGKSRAFLKYYFSCERAPIHSRANASYYHRHRE